MKRILGMLITPLLAVSFIVIPAITQAAASTTPVSNNQKEIILEDVKNDNTTILSRIDIRKKNMAALSVATKTRLSIRCEGAQIKLKTAHSLNEVASLNRINQYTIWVDKIQSLVSIANTGKIDTNIKVELASLKTKVNGLNTLLTTYRQDLTDIAEMNCKTDIDGFKASLDAARLDQAAVVASIKDVHAFVTNTIRPALDKLITAVTVSGAVN